MMLRACYVVLRFSVVHGSDVGDAVSATACASFGVLASVVRGTLPLPTRVLLCLPRDVMLLPC